MIYSDTNFALPASINLFASFSSISTIVSFAIFLPSIVVALRINTSIFTSGVSSSNRLSYSL
ncbi:MAG: hypothetical protein CM15mP54_09950 [Paracoccaceae bacterium]|nr:MAG: hypothetical protein CM15mP54_09950 [Paracoccaceae bacterium]